MNHSNNTYSIGLQWNDLRPASMIHRDTAYSVSLVRRWQPSTLCNFWKIEPTERLWPIHHNNAREQPLLLICTCNITVLFHPPESLFVFRRRWEKQLERCGHQVFDKIWSMPAQRGKLHRKLRRRRWRTLWRPKIQKMLHSRYALHMSYTLLPM